jgi:sortase A
MRGLNRRLSRRSRVEISTLLLFVLLVSPACASSYSMASAEQGRQESVTTASKDRDTGKTRLDPQQTTSSQVGEADSKKSHEDDSGKTVEAVLPEDVLSDQQKDKEPPKYEDWYKESDNQPDTLVSGDSSVGDIPSVKPFNFGRDPGGPEDKTLYLTVPKLGLQKIPVFNEVSKEKLKESVVHVPVTGFPWQKGANTYIAGHRIGYPGTGSSYVFYHLDWLTEGDRIILGDAAGKKYLYRVAEKVAVSPDNVEVMEPKDGKSLVSLQTCTLPDYKKRLIIHGELVQKSA